MSQRPLPASPNRQLDQAHILRAPLVLISCSSHDHQIAEEFYQLLDHRGVAVWCSIYISPDEGCYVTTEEILDLATHVILLVSADSASSRRVRSEIEYALSQEKVVIPIMIDKHPLPVWCSTLESINYEDLNSDEILSNLIKSFPVRV